MTLFLFLSVLSVFGCRSVPESHQGFLHKNLPLVSGDGQDRLPGKSQLDDSVYRRFGEAETFEDLFELENLVRLEWKPDAPLNDVTDVVFHDRHWFVLDRHSPAIFKYTEGGAYVFDFGRIGDGPGALSMPWSIRPVYDGYLGVSDLEYGRILVFDAQGNLVTATDPMIDGERFLSQFAFVWDRADRLYLASFPSANSDAPEHVALDYSGEKGSVLFGFGRRMEIVTRARQRGSGAKPYTAFNRIGDAIWAGSPYTTHLDIFDLEGHAIGTLGADSARIPEAMVTAKDIDALRQSERASMAMENIAQKSSNTRIGLLDDVVLIQMGTFLDFYDTAGNLLKANLSFQPTSHLFITDNRLVMAVSSAAREANINPQLKTALQSMSHDEGQSLYLAVFTFRPFPQL